MPRFFHQASVQRLVLMAYMVLLIPILIMAWGSIHAINAQIRVADQLQTERLQQSKLIKVGEWLRAMNFPLTESLEQPADRALRFEVAKRRDGWRSLKAIMLYYWMTILILGAVLCFALIPMLKRPLDQLIKAIDQLATQTKSDPITVDGPANVRAVSASLEKLRLRLSEEERHQREFLRHVSHEIKTPLTSIREGSQLLDEELVGNISEEQREITQILVRSSADLQQAVENLLNYNSAISVKRVKQREHVDLSLLLDIALEKHALTIKSKHIRISKEVESVQAFVDREQILTVFDNLISNAIKFSPYDSQISIWLSKRLPKGQRFIIKDQGPGVTSDQESSIFDPFYVGQQSVHATIKGTGLGLSIARQYVDDHNGNLTLLKSRRGAAFQVSLP